MANHNEDIGHLILNPYVLCHVSNPGNHQSFKWLNVSCHPWFFEFLAIIVGMRYLTMFLFVFNHPFVLQIEGFVFHRNITVLVQATLLCNLVTEQFMVL
jgi:hypothetical protein